MISILQYTAITLLHRIIFVFLILFYWWIMVYILGTPEVMP